MATRPITASCWPGPSDPCRSGQGSRSSPGSPALLRDSSQRVSQKGAPMAWASFRLARPRRGIFLQGCRGIHAPCSLGGPRAFGPGRRPHLRAAVLVRGVARCVRSDESASCRPMRWTARGCPCQSSGVAGRAQAGCRSEGSIERTEAWRAAVSVRRDGTGSLEHASPTSVRRDGTGSPEHASPTSVRRDGTGHPEHASPVTFRKLYRITRGGSHR